MRIEVHARGSLVNPTRRLASYLAPVPRTVTASAPARTGLVGHPSDGYGGAVVGLALPAFCATVKLRETDDAWPAGGLGSLLDAAVKIHARWAVRVGVELSGTAPRGATVTTEIPREVGLSGSSAVIVAALRALGEWYRRPVHARRQGYPRGYLAIVAALHHQGSHPDHPAVGRR